MSANVVLLMLVVQHRVYSFCVVDLSPFSFCYSVYHFKYTCYLFLMQSSITIAHTDFVFTLPISRDEVFGGRGTVVAGNGSIVYRECICR